VKTAKQQIIYLFKKTKGGAKLKLIKVFEKVNLVYPLEQRQFLNFFEDTVNELEAKFTGFVLSDGNVLTPPESINEDVNILDLYTSAIADNILFLAGAGEIYKNEFLRKSHDAYLKYWSEDAKGRKLRRNSW
jgi:hypothetical protein